jgi:hypothetical protein
MNKASNKSIDHEIRHRGIDPQRFIPNNFSLQHSKIKIKNAQSRSNSNSKLNRSKGKFKGINIAKIKAPYVQNDGIGAKQSNTTKNSIAKSRKTSLEMQMKSSQNSEELNHHHKMHIFPVDYMIKSPHFQIPRGKVQIKQQYLNKQFIQARASGKAKPKQNSRINHSVIYDQVRDLQNL